MNFYINILVIGPVSVGKSTLVSSLFAFQCSDTNIRRTTMMPQIYNESKINLSEDDLSIIREKNREINKKFYDVKVKLDDIEEVEYTVPFIHDITNRHDEIAISICDFPGLDDSMNKDTYYKYLKQNFHRYDIIIFMINIKDSLNTSDEIEILQQLLKSVKNNKKNYDIDNRIIVLLNQCDHLQYDAASNKYLPVNKELKGMVEQVHETIEKYKQEIHPTADIDIFCVSCEDAYIYRSYSVNPHQCLDIKYIDKFGLYECGRSWDRYSDEEKHKYMMKMFETNSYDDRIEKCGFKSFMNHLNNILDNENLYKYIFNYIRYSLDILVEAKISSDVDITNQIDIMVTMTGDLVKINQIFGYDDCTNNDIIFEKISKFLKIYETQHKLNKLNKIKKASDYEKFKIIKLMYEKLRDECLLKNDDMLNGISHQLNQYIVSTINNINSDKTISIQQMIQLFSELKLNNYEYMDLLQQNFNDISSNTIFAKLMADKLETSNDLLLKEIIDCEDMIVNYLKKVREEFNIPYDEFVNMIASNIIKFITFVESNTDDTQSDIAHMNIYSKYLYLDSIHMRSTCKHYKCFKTIKTYVSDWRYNYDTIIKNFSKLQSDSLIETLDVYLMSVLKEKYTNDLYSDDDLLDIKNIITNKGKTINVMDNDIYDFVNIND